MRHFSDDERRIRLAVRHGLSPGSRYPDVEAVARSMTVLHATEASCVYLSVRARIDQVTTGDVARALWDDRTLVKQQAMRRTQFAFPRDLLPAAWGSASARAARQGHTDLARFLRSAGATGDPASWYADAAAAILDVLADGEPRTSSAIRDAVPVLGTQFSIGAPAGKSWGGPYPIGSWVLATLGAEGRIMRARDAGRWWVNRPTWTTTEAWLGPVPEAWPEADGYAELVRRWLWTFGPGTEDDIVWWLGATKTAVRRALADVGAERVGLDRDATGWVLPGDTEPEPDPGPWAALLPTLDPTVMGWKERAFYLDERDRPYLFDTAGNAGNTAWWNGRIVGSWAQDDDGVVQVLPRGELPAGAAGPLEAEAARLTEWLAGERITNVYAARQLAGSLLS